MMENKIILVTGGARSGKSAFAENLVRNSGGKRFYIATAPVLDHEMEDRVRRHKERRENENWTTIEEEIDLDHALESAVRQGAGSILVDCLTLWISNLLYRKPEMDEDGMAELSEKLVKTLKKIPAQTVLVTNETGLGIVPENPLARKFRDLSGKCSQIIAAQADEVYFTVAGIPWRIK